MANKSSVVLMGVTVLVGLSGTRLLGYQLLPLQYRNRRTLTLLAIGFGGAAAVRYFKRK